MPAKKLFLLLLLVVIAVCAPSMWAQRYYSQKAEQTPAQSFRISQTSAAGADRDASSPDVAYNPDDNEYLIVWKGNGLTGVGQQRVQEIFGQRINAASGAEIGADFRISNMSDAGKGWGADEPQVVYNGTAHEYLVVWNGTANYGAPDVAFEIYGQRVSRTGSEAGADFRISNATDLGKVNTSFARASTHADVAWNSTGNQYLVVWSGAGESGETIKTEVYGQLLAATGTSVGNDFRISSTSDQGSNFSASGPVVAYNSVNNRYLVVWQGGFKKEQQTEIWGQSLTDQGKQLGAGNGDFRISQMVVNNEGDRAADSPQIVYNGSRNEYLVVFRAVSLTESTGAGELFGQRLDASKQVEVAPNSELRISNGTETKIEPDNPRVAYDSLGKEYLVVWRGIRTNEPYEIFGQRLSATGAEIAADFQISNIAAVGKDRGVNTSALIYNSINKEYLVVWQGDALAGATGKRVYEIFGQRIKTSSGGGPSLKEE
jgi:hypothetical protein